MPAGLERLNRLSERLADQQSATDKAMQSLSRAQADKHRREVESAEAALRSAEAASETVRSLQALVHAQREASEVEAVRHAQMLRWTKASAVAATAAAILAVVAIVVSVVLAVA